MGDGISSVLENLRATVDRAASPEALATSAKVVAKLVDDGNAELQEALQEDLKRSELITAAEAAVNEALLKQRYIGGCPRDTTGCPKTWTSDQSGTCSPSGDYAGGCGETEVSSLSAVEKEEFAVMCKAEWPCARSLQSYEGCPIGWSAVGAVLCVAPPSYDGMCSPAMDFGAFSVEQKAAWAASCHTRWPSA